MYIYILKTNWDSEILGCFSTKEEARKYALKYHEAGDVTIEKRRLNPNTEEIAINDVTHYSIKED